MPLAIYPSSWLKNKPGKVFIAMQSIFAPRKISPGIPDTSDFFLTKQWPVICQYFIRIFISQSTCIHNTKILRFWGLIQSLALLTQVYALKVSFSVFCTCYLPSSLWTIPHMAMVVSGKNGFSLHISFLTSVLWRGVLVAKATGSGVGAFSIRYLLHWLQHHAVFLAGFFGCVAKCMLAWIPWLNAFFSYRLRPACCIQN